MNPVEENRKNNFLEQRSKKCKFDKKAKKLNFKNLIDKIHKFISKDLKFNINCCIKTCKIHKLLEV